MVKRKRKNGRGFAVIFTGVKKKKPFFRSLLVEGGRPGAFGTKREAEVARRSVFRQISIQKKKKFKLKSRIIKI